MATTRGLPARTAYALERLGRDDLSSASVAIALDEWRAVVRKSRAELARPHNDWTELIGPAARTTLEAALQALRARDAAPLRRELAGLDAAFERKTSNNPFADPALPWWARRWSH